MKQLFFLTAVLAISLTSMAQGNGKGKGKGNGNGNGHGHKPMVVTTNANVNGNGTAVVNSHGNGNAGKVKGYSKNQPPKVRAALLKDYPNASNVTWDKYKGDYTATFTNGIWRSTAVYHANGERRDTRTPLTREQLPGSIWDRIFKRDRVTPTQYIQIERPSTAEKIFRILSSNNTPYYYDQNGNRVTYVY